MFIYKYWFCDGKFEPRSSFNEQTELKSKIQMDSWIESRLSALEVGLRGGRMEQKRKKTLDKANNVVIAGARRGVGRWKSISGGINGNGKKHNTNFKEIWKKESMSLTIV